MKKIITILTLMLSLVLTGCKTTSITTESAYKTGSAAGLATGYFIKTSKIDVDVKNSIIEIINDVSYIIPIDSQSFINAWTSSIKTKVDKYCEKKMLTDLQKTKINNAFIIITDAINHLFMKNEKLQISTDIAISTIDGFCKAFTSVINTSFASKMTYDVDSEMYMYLKAKFAK
jgi:hypothetical protein